jgi:hypothetical protein
LRYGFFCLSTQDGESMGKLSRDDAVTTIEELGFRPQPMPYFEMGDILGNEWTVLVWKLYELISTRELDYHLLNTAICLSELDLNISAFSELGSPIRRGHCSAIDNHLVVVAL